MVIAPSRKWNSAICPGREPAGEATADREILWAGRRVNVIPASLD